MSEAPKGEPGKLGTSLPGTLGRSTEKAGSQLAASALDGAAAESTQHPQRTSLSYK